MSLIVPLELTGLTKVFPTPAGPFVAVKDVNVRIQNVGIHLHRRALRLRQVDRPLDHRGPSTGHRGRRGHQWQADDRTGRRSRRGFSDAVSAAVVDRPAECRAGCAAEVQCAQGIGAPRARAEYLALTGVADAADQLPAEMSLGMQQCVSLARALSLEPELLLLDEPFSMLDSLTRLDLQDTLLRAWEQDRKIVVMVTHDVDEALYLADRIVLMTDGPAAHVGDIMTVPFARPRDRHDVLEHRDYRRLRQSIIDFLENHAKQSVGS